MGNPIAIHQLPNGQSVLTRVLTVACAFFILFGLWTSRPVQADALSLSSVEYSMVRLLANDAFDTAQSHSATISFRAFNPNAELAFPILWMGEGKEPLNPDDPHCCKHNFFSMDVQYRQFFNDRRDGWYFGAVARGVTSNGTIDGQFSRQTQFGVGLTLGYRHVYQDFMFWQVGVTAVHYRNEFEEFDEVVISSAEAFREQRSVTYDFLKIGFLIP